MRRIVAVLLSLGCLGTLSFAQHAAVSATTKDPTGTVIGHVYCSDTDRPARFAKVILEPTRDVSDYDAKKEQTPSPLSLIPTKLDGSFVISNVKPGTYFVLAEAAGYVLPLAQFTQQEMAKPTPEVKQELMKKLRKVTVEANQTASVEIRLERGAAISGTLTFDDGSPAAGISMEVLRRGGDKKWMELSYGVTGGAGPHAETDDQGHYRISGLPAGEYTVEASLVISDVKSTRSLVGNGPSSMSWSSRFSLPIYSGGGNRKKDATAFNLSSGEERAGEDIVIPLAKFHTVTGTVVAAHDGHQVNAGRVSLLFADDKSTLTSVDIDKDDGAFHFEFVPEGDYLLEIKDARDVNREEIMNPPGMMPPSQVKETELHAYGTGDQPLSLHGETNSVVIAVPEKNAKPVTASAQ